MLVSFTHESPFFNFLKRYFLSASCAFKLPEFYIKVINSVVSCTTIKTHIYKETKQVHASANHTAIIWLYALQGMKNKLVELHYC